MKTLRRNGIAAALILVLATMLLLPSLAFAAPKYDQRGSCFKGVSQSYTQACINYTNEKIKRFCGNQQLIPGVNYMDENNNGICDNFEANDAHHYEGKNQGTGTGRTGTGMGKHCR